MRPHDPQALRTGTWAWVAPLSAFILSLLAAQTRAEHVVHSPVVEPGDWSSEFGGNFDVDDSRPLDRGNVYTVNVVWSPFARWASEAEIEVERELGEDLRTTAVSWANVLQVARSAEQWCDLALYAEFAHTLERDASDGIEFGVLAQKDFGWSETRVNLLMGRELEHGADVEVSYSWQWRYRLTERLEPGLEMYGGLGRWGAFGALDEHGQEFGPALNGSLPFGGGSIGYEVGLLFGLTGPDRGTTARFSIEYEF